MKLTTAAHALDLKAIPGPYLGGSMTDAVSGYAAGCRMALGTGHPSAIAGQIQFGEQLLATIPANETDLREAVLASMRTLRAA